MIRFGSIIAWFLIGIGAFRAATGFFVAIYFVNDTDMISAAKRYLGSSPADAQDHGMLVLIAGVVLGLLVKIAKRSS